MQTALVFFNEELTILRWVYGNNIETNPLFIASQYGRIIENNITFDIRTSDCVIMDISDCGESLVLDHKTAKISPGLYSIATEEYKTPEHHFVIHRFKPAQ